MHRYSLLILFVVIVITGIMIGVSTNTSRKIKNTASVSAVFAQENSPSVIDGSVHPELIPDRVAYALLFRLISNRQTEGERKRIRAYIRQMGLGKQACKECPSTGIGDTDIDALIAAAEEFQQRVSVLDRQAKKLKEDNRSPNPNPETVRKLAQLQREKEAIVEEIVASLPSRLSAGGRERVRQHISERVKPKVKIVQSHSHQP